MLFRSIVLTIARDISERKQLEEKIRHMAFHDILTGLPNRYMIIEHLKKSMARLKRTGDSGVVLFIDLDGFKEVNDTMGHDVGDLLLQKVAGKLKVSVREEDVVGRLGGDEFIVVLEEYDNEKVLKVGDRILNEFSNLFYINDYVISVTPSIGISMYPGEAGDAEDIIK